MKAHTKLYLQSLQFSIADFVPCEICRQLAVDIHHIKARGMGGTKKQDTIENLMALCRQCHERYGDKKQHTDELQNIHNNYLRANGIMI